MSKKKDTFIKYHKHPLFGNIPMIQIKNKIAGNVEWEYDSDYLPDIPEGAIRGNIKKQVYCSYCNAPQYFYVDQDKICIQCGKSFLFSASEQKYWYETLQFINHSTAIRCPNCRKKNRTKRALNNDLEKSINLMDKFPNDPDALLNFVQSTIRYYEHTNQGNLEKAINICRKALEIAPSYLECIFWEAECHFYYRNYNKAIENYNNFYSKTSDLTRWKKLRRIIKVRLNELLKDK